jgi:hypothetical protein
MGTFESSSCYHIVDLILSAVKMLILHAFRGNDGWHLGFVLSGTTTRFGIVDGSGGIPISLVPSGIIGGGPDGSGGIPISLVPSGISGGGPEGSGGSEHKVVTPVDTASEGFDENELVIGGGGGGGGGGGSGRSDVFAIFYTTDVLSSLI